MSDHDAHGPLISVEFDSPIKDVSFIREHGKNAAARDGFYDDEIVKIQDARPRPSPKEE